VRDSAKGARLRIAFWTLRGQKIKKIRIISVKRARKNEETILEIGDG
jgi:uncharacterized DUF497 family protein